MPGDYSRETFDARKRYAAVLMQQGRVQLDADWNEQGRIRRHRDETEARDVIGCCGAPLAGGGFGISELPEGVDLAISPGRIYVDGILCELDAAAVPAALIAGSPPQLQLESLYVDGYPLEPGNWVEVSAVGETPVSPPLPVVALRVSTVNEEAATLTVDGDLSAFQSSPPPALALRRITTFLTQPDFPNPGIENAASPPPVIASPPGQLVLPPGVYLAYLDVWHREVTAHDDPRIREVALGGPDTAARLKTTRQVRLIEVAAASPPDVSCSAEFPEWDALTASPSGRLNARTQAASADDNPCQLPPSAGYRRLENQLYRVEVHDGGSREEATYKWSRDNGSVETKILDIDVADGTRVEVSSTGRDEALGFRPGQWVEIVDDESELKGQPHPLVQIDEVSPGQNLIVLKNDISSHRGTARKLRRWDHSSMLDSGGNLQDAGGAVPMTAVDAEGWAPLEGGIEVEFGEGSYRPGDYWLIPARTNTGEIEWPPFAPRALPIPQAPFGIDHHYCRLALVEVASDGALSVSDCRCRFPSLGQTQSLYYVSGDGQEAMPVLPSNPGDVIALPQPLVAGVVNPQCRDSPAVVRFAIIKGTGQLHSIDGFDSGTDIDVPVDADGLAACRWDLGADLTTVPARDENLPSQQVEAWLLDEAGLPIHLPIRFNANLSVAELVAYDPGACAGLSGQTTVQTAIDRLASQLSLYKVSGDGQILQPNQTLDPIRVGAANHCGPVPLQPGWVAFNVLSGGGSVSAGSIDANGVVSVAWTLGPGSDTQELEAVLQPPAGPSAPPSRVVFTATRFGAGAEPGVHVERIITPSDGQPLRNDNFLTVPRLASGFDIICDEALSPESGGGVPEIPQSSFPPHTVPPKPTCIVTLDLPYPLGPDRDVWSFGDIAGFQPLIVGSTITIIENVLEWRPTDAARRWLGLLFPRLNIAEVTDRILGHLVLKGNFIWRATDDVPDLYLDGEVFGRPDPQGRVAVRLPSGNQLRGGDLEMWFWLTREGAAPVDDIIIVGTPVALGVVGIVRDASGPIAGAPVTLAAAGQPGRTALTNNEGNFRFFDVSPGVYTVSVAFGGRSASTSVVVPAGTNVFDPAVFPNVRLRDVGGIGAVMERRLAERGIDHPALVASMEPDALAEILNVNPARAETLIGNARELLRQ